MTDMSFQSQKSTQMKAVYGDRSALMAIESQNLTKKKS